ncbi:4Fe-4S ferredoxin [Pseudomonas nicosulfuronedens]
MNVDVLIVGSGPAGVSAAFPLLASGYTVLMVDGGRMSEVAAPQGRFLDLRERSPLQADWMVGRNFQALRNSEAASPKLRVPTHSYVFEDFHASNRINPSEFISLGSLAPGGLSNAWGCGVAKLSPQELAAFPFPGHELDASYARVAKRIGISGASPDDLSEYFGLDDAAQPPVSMDDLQVRMLQRYAKRRGRSLERGFRLGRSRVAVLTEDIGERRACDLSGNCLWGCGRRSLYSATEDLALLKQHPGFHYRSGFVVEEILGSEEERVVVGRGSGGREALKARTVMLAAGTLATSRLALGALGHHQPIAMQACPIAAFMLWLPTMLGRRRGAEFGLGQLSFTLTLAENVTGFGSFFSTTGIPLSEFVRFMPLRKRYGIDVLSSLLSSCVVGNMFLPGHLTGAMLKLGSDGSLSATGSYLGEVDPLMRSAEKKLRRELLSLGAVLLPGSFTVGRPGGDIHYACSLPMRSSPKIGETFPTGELAGATGIYVVDGASLPSLSEKSHTMTIMANADRIGRALSLRLNEKPFQPRQ